MQNRDALIALYKDADFKSTFLAGYIESGVHHYVAEKEFSNAFSLLVEDTGMNGAPPISSASLEDIKRTFLAISSHGLSFDRAAKEIYLQGETVSNGKVVVTCIIGYRGMNRIISNSKNIFMHSTEIVYEDDSFTWLGTDQRPNYASNGRTQNSNVVCGFTLFKFTDGSVLCHRSSASELLEIEQQSIQQTIDMGGDESGSIYNSAWRERCLRILALRAAFREHQHLFISEKDLISSDSVMDSEQRVPISKFEKMLSDAIQEENKHVSNA